MNIIGCDLHTHYQVVAWVEATPTIVRHERKGPRRAQCV